MFLTENAKMYLRSLRLLVIIYENFAASRLMIDVMIILYATNKMIYSID